MTEPELGLPREWPDRPHSYHLYPVQLDLERLTAGIGASVHFIPVHLHPYYGETGGYGPEAFPVAQRIYQRLVTDADVEGVTRAVRRVVVAHRR